jgi:hypothetical protein
MLKREQLWKHLCIAFAAALAIYLAGFSWMEHRRARLGPWEVTFVKDATSAPQIRINQRALQITNVQLQFITSAEVGSTNVTVEFVAGHAVPFAVPFGECVFMDPLFLPGTVTLELFDHQVELLPRSLRIDDRQHDWKSGAHFEVNARP